MTPKQRIRVASPLTLVTLVVVAALSIATWAVLRSGVERQNKALIQNGAAQVTLVLQALLQNIQTQLRSLAFLTSSSGNSTAVFDEQAKAILTNPQSSVALVDISGSSPNILMARGPSLHPGQVLSPAVASFVSAGSPALSSLIVHSGTATDLALSASSTLRPKLVALELSPVDPSKATPDNSGPYRNIYIDVYNGRTASRDTLVLTTFGPAPLPSPVATSLLKFGKVTWLVQAAAKSPPAGAYATASPWVALGVGLLVAVVLAALVETLARRNRHSARLVEQRTAELLSAQKTIIRNERLAAVGELATVVSHELRNPLGAALNNLFLTRLELGDRIAGDLDRHLSSAEREVNRAARLSDDLTAYMREREPQFSPVEFSELAAEVLASTPAPDGIEVTVESTAIIDMDRVLMFQVLTNLITNAYQAMTQGGAVRLSAVAGPAPKITVEDSGEGFDPTIADRIFDPFFTTKDEGTGLGLAIVQRLVEAQGGDVSIDNATAGGARVSISLPLRPER